MNEVACPSCSKQLQFNPQQAGKQVRCPACQTVMILPGAPNQGTSTNRPSPSQTQPVSPGSQQSSPLLGQTYDPLAPANQQSFQQTPAAYPQSYASGPQSNRTLKKINSGNPFVLWGSIGGGALLIIVIVCLVAFRPGDENEVASTNEGNNSVGNLAKEPEATIVCKDDFEDGTIAPLWTSTTTKGLTITESNGAVKISGMVPRHPERYVSALMNLSEKFQARSFTAEIDVLASSGTFEGSKHRQRHFGFFATGNNKNTVGVQYWSNQYRLSYNDGSGGKRKYAPSNGDEITKSYRWRIDYDAPNRNASVSVDGRQIGDTVTIDLGETVTFKIQLTCIPKTQIEGSFDNFQVRMYPAGQSPPSIASKVSNSGSDNAPNIIGGSIPIPSYLVESKSRITDVERGALFPAVFRESSKATLFAYECKDKNVKEVVEWFKKRAPDSDWELADDFESEISPAGVQLILIHTKIDQVLYVEIGSTRSRILRVLFSLMKRK